MTEQQPPIGSPGAAGSPLNWPAGSPQGGGGPFPPPAPSPQAAALPTPWVTAPAPPPKRKGRGWLVLMAVLLLSSVGMNLLLIMALARALGAGGKYRTEVLQEGSAGEIVAVVPVYGVIDGPMATWVKKLLKDLADDKSVKIAVLHVDSPGGMVGASDEINHAIQKYRQETGRQVIISQGGYATSGGYYISAAGDYIVAEPTTWTGNIGVIMTTFVARQGLEEKLGVKPVVITSGHTPFKDVPSLFRDMEPAERVYVQGLIESAYQRFVDVVADGRKGHKDLTREKVVELANGKVYTADEALDKGLVDAKGYLEDAWKVAGQRAGLNNPRVVLYKPRLAGLAEVLLGKSSVPVLDKLADDPLQSAEGMFAPRLLYLYHGQTPINSWPKMRYTGD